MFQVALLFLGLGNLLCGFAKTPVQLYIFRAISGLGGGGVNGIAMTIVGCSRIPISSSANVHPPQVSDIVSLKDRGAYQGLISGFCTAGSAVGPFLGGGLASAGQWRWLFWSVWRQMIHPRRQADIYVPQDDLNHVGLGNRRLTLYFTVETRHRYHKVCSASSMARANH